jgi:hypothetical protein
MSPGARQRQGEGVANATINRELAALKRALMLAHRAESKGNTNTLLQRSPRPWAFVIAT